MDNKKINKLVADKVMGYEVLNEQYSVVNRYGSPEEFRPSEHIDDSWEIIKKMENKFSFELSKEDTDDYYICEFTSFNQFLEVDIYTRSCHESPEMAICIAALETVGIRIN